MSVSGVNPQRVRGSRTGVFIGSYLSEAYDAWTAADSDQLTGYEITGCSRAMFANRLSYFFDFRGLYCDMNNDFTAAAVTRGVARNLIWVGTGYK